MMTARCFTVGDKIIGARTGSVHESAMVDGLGSITTSSVSGSVGVPRRFSPYGKTLPPAPLPLPRLSWVGSYAYLSVNGIFLSHYVRARHYSASTAKWSSADPIWPKIPPYIYGSANPTSRVDPTGLQDWQQIIPGIIDVAIAAFCAAYPRIKYGITMCDPKTGSPFTIQCDKHKCSGPCTELHEAVHPGQLKGCCSRYKKCWDKYAGKPIYQQINCVGPWSKYTEANRPAWECEAYKVSLPCALDAWTDNCLACRVVTAECCDELWNALIDDYTEMDQLKCGQDHKIAKCPFDASGNLVSPWP